MIVAEANIRDDIAAERMNCNDPWIMPAIYIKKLKINPFLFPDQSKINENKLFRKTVVGSIFIKSLVQMEFVGSNDQKTQKTDDWSNLASDYLNINDVNKTFVKNSIGMIDIKNQLMSRSPILIGSEISNLKSYPAKIKSFNLPTEAIEPIIIAMSLYSLEEKRFISEVSYSLPDFTKEMFNKNDIKIDDLGAFVFRIDPKFIDNVIIIITFYHPCTVDFCSNTLKYYQNPSQTHKEKAEKAVSSVFPIISNMFSPFATTFIDMSTFINSNEIVAPTPVFCTVWPEEGIPDLINEMKGGKMKQFNASLVIQRTDEQGIHIRPVSRYRHNPYLSPINQLVVRPISYSGKSLFKRNIVVRFSILNQPGGTPIRCIANNLGFAEQGEAYTHIWDHRRAAVFQNCFVANLPYPMPEKAVVQFTVFQFIVKSNSHSFDEVGSCEMPLLDENGIFANDGERSLTTTDGEEFKFRLFLRSNAETSDHSFMSIAHGNPVDVEVLEGLSDDSIATHFFVILDGIVKQMRSMKEEFLMHLSLFLERALKVFDETTTSKLLMLYVRFFALSHEGSKRISEFDLEEMEGVSSQVSEAMQSGATDIINEEKETFAGVEDISNFYETEFFDEKYHTANSVVSGDFHEKVMWRISSMLMANYHNIELLENTVEFVLMLIIKSIAISDKKLDLNLFKRFVSTFSLAVSMIEKKALYIRHFAQFLNLIYETGNAAAAIDGIGLFLSVMLPKEGVEKLITNFVTFAIRPSMFMFGSKHYQKFRGIFKALLIRAIMVREYRPLGTVFVNICSEYNEYFSQEIATILIDALTLTTPSRYPATPDIAPVLMLMAFIMANGAPEKLENEQQVTEMAHLLLSQINFKMIGNGSDPNQSPIAGRARFDAGVVTMSPDTDPIMIAKIAAATRGSRRGTMKNYAPPPVEFLMALPEKKEDGVELVIHNAQKAIVCFSDFFADGALSISIVHHTLCILKTESVAEYALSTLESVLERDIKGCMNAFDPSLFDVTKRILFLTRDMNTTQLARPILKMFEAEFAAYGNTLRSLAVLSRVIALLPNAALQSESTASFFGFLKQSKREDVQKCITKYEKMKESTKLGVETQNIQQAEALYSLLPDFTSSPDTQIEFLGKMDKLQDEDSAETLQILLNRAAISLEYMCATRTATNVYNVEHPCTLFNDICPMCEQFKAPKEIIHDVPRVQSFADSIDFTLLGFLINIKKAIMIAKKLRLYETVLGLVDIVWPLLEEARMYSELDRIFEMVSDSMEEGVLNPQTEAMENRYFKVTFYGKLFGVDNGKTFVYRTNPLTHLFVFSKNLENTLKTLYGNDKIETINDSGQVDTEKLDPEKGYIQPVFVNAEKAEDSQFCNTFFFDTPFVKEGKRAQGTIETQWIRRTYVMTDFLLPSVLYRSPVSPENIRLRDFSPIEVSTRQIRERAEIVKAANDAGDAMKLQQLLHGTLIPQVNEGPAKIAEVFLGEAYKSDEDHQKEMRAAFDVLMCELQRGVKIHEKWVASNQNFETLQLELENGLENLENTVSSL